MGNHFSNNGSSNTPSNYQGRRFKQQPDTTSAYLNASRSAHGAQGPRQGRAQEEARRTQDPYRGGAGRAQAPRRAPTSAPTKQNPYRPAPTDKRAQNGKRGGRKRCWPVVVGVIVAIVLALGIVGGVAGMSLLNDVKLVKNDALAIVDSASSLKEALSSGSDDMLSATADDIETRAARMHETTQGLWWNVAAMVPVYGSDVASVQTLSASLDTLARDVASPLLNSLQGMNASQLIGEDGAINVDAISAVADALVNSKDAVHQAAADIEALPDAHIAQLQDALEKVKPIVRTLDKGVNAASEIAPYLPAMLGADGQTRTYILVAQNNSELRATGGYPGSSGLITVTDGKISLGEFSGAKKLIGDDHPVEPDDIEKAMFGTEVASTAQLITTNPDFTVTGKHIRDLWAARVGDEADGVVALDPLFLQHLLALTGSVTLSDGMVVDGTNAASYLLHTVYATKPVDVQDAFFAEAAGLSADKIMSGLGSADLGKLVKTVSDDAKNGRIMVWMADENEQNVMEQLGLANGISTDPSKPVLGVYVNDNTWAKMSWYLSVDTQIGEGVKNPDGTTSYQVTSTFKNNITADEAASAEKYITGYNPDKNDASTMINEIYLYAPAGGSISNIQVSTGEQFGESSYGDIQTWRISPQLKLNAQQTSTITYTVITSAEATEPLALRTTPTAQEAAGW